MAIIKFQPRPKVPPIGFFQPISADPKDMMTDVEYLLGILKKLNETIKQVNSNTEFIDSYSGKIEELEGEIAQLKQDMINFENEVNTNIENRFAAIITELNSMIATTLMRANAYTDATASILRDEIRQIALGQITVFDPTTGSLNDLQSTLDNMYGATREEAITASEYDGLELTATYYDGLEITAFDYDRYAKTILMDVSA